MNNLDILILFGGKSSEREVSARTAVAIYESLKNKAYERVNLLDISFNIGQIAESKPDICIIAVHGSAGEDGKLQGYLDMLEIPYTGSDVEASALAFNKYLSKICFEANNIPTPAYFVAGKSENKFTKCVVKPVRQGSTVGISVVSDKADYEKAINYAYEFDSFVMVEEFISGKEFTVSIFNGEALPIIWIRPKSGFYDYESKYTKGHTEYLFETGLTEDEEQIIKKIALDAYNALGCSGVARVDFIYDGKTPYVLEVNTVPGMTETSLLPKAAQKAGISFIQLVEMMMKDGLERKR